MYHVLGSTLWSLFLGWLVGAGFRVYFHFFLFNAHLSFGLNSRFLAELVLLLFLFASASLLFCVIWRKGRKKLENEYCLIMTAFTKSKLYKIEKDENLKKEFEEILTFLRSKVSEAHAR